MRKQVHTNNSEFFGSSLEYHVINLLRQWSGSHLCRFGHLCWNNGVSLDRASTILIEIQGAVRACRHIMREHPYRNLPPIMSCLSVKRRSNILRWCRFRASGSWIFKYVAVVRRLPSFMVQFLLCSERDAADLLAVRSMSRQFSGRATLEEAPWRKLLFQNDLFLEYQ